MTPEANQIIQIAKVSDTVLSATQSLIQYLEGHVSKTEVVNQLESIHTPDVQYVVEALQVLDSTLKTHENVDLTEITGVMRELLSQAQQIPKTYPEDVDYTGQLSGLRDAIKAVEKVIKAQKLVAEAPVVNVPETNVHVDAPDLKPLQDGFKDVVSAVKAIVIPEFKTDNKAVEKLLTDANKLLERILKKPVSAGGGGGGSSWPAISTVSGNPAPLTVNSTGSLQIIGQVVTERFATAGGYDYIGEAPVGSSESASVWTISRYDATSGKVAVNAAWTDYLTGTYL